MSDDQPAIELDPRAIHTRLSAFERDIAEGRYQQGLWPSLLRDVRHLKRGERIALKESISRISEQLHARKGRRRVAFHTGILAEVALVLLGGFLLWVGARYQADWSAVLGALAWTMAFQPLIKCLAGLSLGIRYDHAYLLGPEPRFKMRYGSYLASPRASRIAFHLSGMVGSPLGAWLAMRFLGAELRGANAFCWGLFVFCVALNLVPLALGLMGLERIGPVRLSLGSAGSAALEVREALERR
jgi:hypothetical protein